MDWKDLQELVDYKQTGELPPPDGGIDLSSVNWDNPEEKAVAKQYLNSALGIGRGNTHSGAMSILDDYSEERQNNPVDLNELGEQVGYGENRRDWRTPVMEFAQDPQNYRANAQSQANKIINGGMKLLPTAFTTLADNTVGLVMSLISLGEDALDGNGMHMSSFTDTAFGEKMQDYREKIDSIFPNYRTTQEEADADQWWKHLNGNFWGDAFLKNLGFTLGAGWSGKLYAGAFRAAQGKLVNQAYKAAVTAAAKGENELDAFRKVLQGASLENPQKVYRQLEKISKTYNRLGWESQLLGSLGGAIGESRTEAIGAAREFRDEELDNAINDYTDGKRQIALELDANDEFWEERPVYDGYGNIIDTEPALNDDGIAYRDKRLKEIQEKYNAARSIIDNEAERLANHTFWLNMPLLTGTNAIMFGRMFAGGFRTQANNRFRGKAGNLKGVGSVARSLGMSAEGVISEGMEELTQKVFSEGQKDISKQNMAAFYNGKYDTDAIKGVAQWLTSMLDSAGEVLGQGSSWEEFTIGALTGGMGHVANFSRTNDGKIHWDPQGNVITRYKQGIKERDENRAAAKKLNELYNSKDFQDRWAAMVRHKKSDDIKDVALAANQKFVWKTEDEKQLLGDVIAFADAGRLNDLEGYVDAFGRLTADEIHEFRDMFSDETNSEFQNKTDEEILDWIKERVSEVKDAIRQYRNFHDTIDFLSLGTSDADVINELVFTASQLENFEKRYQKLADEVWKKIEPTVRSVSEEKTKKGEYTKKALSAQKILSEQTNTQRLFGTMAIDISDRTGENSIQSLLSHVLDDTKQQDVLDMLEEWGAFASDPTIKQEVQDLQKLVRARQAYYAKLFDPSFRKKFEEEKKSPDKVIDDTQDKVDREKAQATIDELKKANTLKEYINTLLSLDEPTKGQEKHETAMINADPKLKVYSKLFDKAKSFVEDLQREVDSRSDKAPDTEKITWEAVASAIGQVSAEQAILDSDRDEDPTISIGKLFLSKVAGNTEAEEVVRKILQDALKDVATANGLGAIKKPTPHPPAPAPGGNSGQGQGGGEGQGGQGGTGGGEQDAATKSAEQLQKALDMLGKVISSDSVELNKILNGDFSSYPDLIAEDKVRLQSEAIKAYKELKKKEGEIADTDVDFVQPEDQRGSAEAKRQYRMRRERSVDATAFSVEDTDSAKNGRRALHRNESEGTNRTIQWLANHKVHSFVNSGALAKLADAYRRAGKELPIRFIGNPHINSGNPFAIKGGKVTPWNKFGISMGTLILAVDMDEIVPGTSQTARQYLSQFESTGAFDKDSLIPISREEGNATHDYQVVGTILTHGDEFYKDKKNIPQQEKDARLMWEHAVKRSIFPQYYADSDNVGSGNMPEEGKWYVARIHPVSDTRDNDVRVQDWTTGKKIYTTLNYIMPGRKETRNPVNGEAAVKKPISESLHDYLASGKKVHYAIITGDGAVATNGSPAFPEGSIMAPEGSLWIATQNSDGSWSWDPINIARTNDKSVEHCFDIKTNASPIAQELKKLLDIILADQTPWSSEAEKADDFLKRSAAIRKLEDIFYLGSGNTFHLVFNEFGAALLVGDSQVECNTPEEVVKELRKGNFRFQVTTADINDPGFMDRLMQEGVFLADMESFERIASNIGVNRLSDRDADNNEVDVHVLQSHDPMTVGMEDPGFVSKTRGSVQLGNRSYRVNRDGTVSDVSNGTNEPVTSNIISAIVKTISELLEMDANGQLGAHPARYIIDEPNVEYTELYERTIDGVKVQIERRGRNGAFMVQYDKSRWEEKMKIAEKQKPLKQSSGDMSEQEMFEKFDKLRASEDSGGGSSARIDRDLDDDVTPEDSPTPQEAEQDDLEQENENDCGIPIDL